MTLSLLAAYLKRTGVPNNAILTGRDLQLMHHNCIYENLDLSSRNFNIWQSVVYLFSFLIKAAEMVPVLYQNIQQIELNNVTAVIQAIDEFSLCYQILKSTQEDLWYRQIVLVFIGIFESYKQ